MTLTFRLTRRASLLAGAALLTAAAPAAAQNAPNAQTVVAPEVVVSANRVATAPEQVGSTVSVVKGEEIERRGKLSLIDALAGVPGLSFTRNGGVGATTQIKLRGGDSGQTQVLLDGVQLNDGASTDNSFDFDMLAAGGIDRVEVLRGPQSALYGADAMTGVVNIITTPGRGPLKASARSEFGSFHTIRNGASFSGGGERFGAALNGSWQRSEGFTRAANSSEKDGFNQRGVNGSFNADLTDIWTVNVTAGLFDGRSEYDSTTADTLNRADKTLRYGKLDNTVTLLDGRLENILSLSVTDTDRSYDEPASARHSNYASTRDVAEYRGNLKLRAADVLSFGAMRKRESAKVATTVRRSRSTDVDRSVDTHSLYGQYLLAATDALHLTLGARHDNNEDFGANTTWRLAGAWRLTDSGATTLRGSLGAGAKAPTLYQLYAPIYGNPNLTVEKSLGADLGVEQAFLNKAVTASATLFWNRFENLINFENSSYLNVGKAHTEGLELAARWAVAANLSTRASYTYTLAENDTTNRWLARRPRHMGSVSADWTPLDGLDLGGAVRLVGEQLDSTFSNRVNNAFTVVDLDAAYAVTGNVSVYGRLENLFNADYEEVRGYNTPGRAAYAGVKLKL